MIHSQLQIFSRCSNRRPLSNQVLSYDMFPLPLLPVVGDDLLKMDSRIALRYQNTFMKNALVRALNNLHDQARNINDGSHPKFKVFMSYCRIVYDMVQLHIEGDYLFFTKVGPCKSLDEILGGAWTNNPLKQKLQDGLSSWNSKLQGWVAKPAAYRGAELLSLLDGLEVPLTKGLFELVHSVKPEIISKKVSNEQMQGMIGENIVWLATKSDLTILLPFCTSHHDCATSKFWPVISDEGLAALPQMAKQHSSQWALAPFDPVLRVKNTKP